jgi:hypothetical protein
MARPGERVEFLADVKRGPCGDRRAGCYFAGCAETGQAGRLPRQKKSAGDHAVLQATGPPRISVRHR